MVVSDTRRTHWVKKNHQNRIPKRWVAFDTEAIKSTTDGVEVQTWKMGAAIRWRQDLKTGDHVEKQSFTTPLEMWQWIAGHCRPEQRTVVFAHNLGYDVRIADVLGILPKLGFRLEWCNLDSSVSSMTWRSERGTLVFADTFTWLPMQLEEIAPLVGLKKLHMPVDSWSEAAWTRYCMRDAEIVYRAVSELVNYISDEDLGNWQPTGAGMAYATWRHRYMTHNVLVHDDPDAIEAEREAMHTGRAEAWRHGELTGDTWTEVDLRNAYIRIASECSLPCKLKYHNGAITLSQYTHLALRFRVLAKCYVATSLPVVPCKKGGRTLWPVGTFTTWLWDVEIDELIKEGQDVRISEVYVYTRGPLLADWAKWVLGVAYSEDAGIPPVVRKWVKHCGRALIGRIALRIPNWELFGENPVGEAGVSHMVDTGSGHVSRMMHVGNQTFVETDRTEGRDSLPQITGWIMAECRMRLWRAMRDAGLNDVAHVDTDSLIVSADGLRCLRRAMGDAFDDMWQVKGAWHHMHIYGPRNYRAAGMRKTSGVPRKAIEVEPNVFTGEKWSGIATDLQSGHSDRVTVSPGAWKVKSTDPRRWNASGASTYTRSVQLADGASVASSSSPSEDVGP